MDRGSAHPWDLVRGDRYTNPAATDTQTQVGFAGSDRATDRRSEVRVVDAIGAVGSEVDDLVPQLGKVGDKFCLEVEPGVVAAGCNASHGRTLVGHELASIDDSRRRCGRHPRLRGDLPAGLPDVHDVRRGDGARTQHFGHWPRQGHNRRGLTARTDAAIDHQVDAG